MKVTSKLFILCTMFIGFCASTAAQTWTWTGEEPTSGNSYYLFADLNDGVARFLNNTTNSFDSAPTVLWAMGGTFKSSYNLTSVGGKFAIRKPFTSTTVETNSNQSGDDVTLSSDGSSAEKYTIYRSNKFTAGGDRNIAVSTSGISTASSATQCWRFVSEAEVATYNNYITAYNKAFACGVSSDILDANNTANISDVASKIETLANAIADKLAAASLTSPLNLTALIVNPGFEASPWNLGWNGTGDNKEVAFAKNDNHTIYAEMYVGAAVGGKIYQTISNLPKGCYTLSASIAGDVLNSVYAKVGNQVYQQAKGEGNWITTSVVFSIDEEQANVEIGFERPSNVWWWSAVDDFTLTYHGNTNLVLTGSWEGKYLYTTTNTDGDVAFGRGASWGTQAIPTNAEPIKLDINITNGIASIKYTDTNLYLYDAGGYNMFTDKAEKEISTRFFAVSEGEGYKFILATDPNYAIGLGTDAINPGYAERDHIDKNTIYNVLKLVPTNDAPVWYFADAKVNMKVAAEKYGTFVAPFDVTLPAGITAYTAKAEDNTVQLNSIKTGGETLSAGTPVIVKGADINTNFFGAETAEVEASSDGNDLVGLYQNGTTIPEGAYVMQTQDGKQAFYKVTPPFTFTGTANRCYLAAPSGARVLTFDNETAITEIENESQMNNVIFDLAGRRISNTAKGGIYIINGKKVIK